MDKKTLIICDDLVPPPCSLISQDTLDQLIIRSNVDFERLYMEYCSKNNINTIQELMLVNLQEIWIREIWPEIENIEMIYLRVSEILSPAYQHFLLKIQEMGKQICVITCECYREEKEEFFRNHDITTHFAKNCNTMEIFLKIFSAKLGGASLEK